MSDHEDFDERNTVVDAIVGQIVSEDQPDDPERRALLQAGLTLGKAAFAFGAFAAALPFGRAASALTDMRNRGMQSFPESGTRDSQSTRSNTQATPQPSPSPSPTLEPQSTPTPDATVTALQRRLLQDQAEQAEDPWGWAKDNAVSAAGTALTLLTIYAGIRQFRSAQKTARKQEEHEQKQAQEQQRLQLFQNALAGLGSEGVEAKTAAGTMFLIFLREPGYKQFRQYIFDLAVTHLRLREPDRDERGAPKPPSQFDREIVKVFTASAPLVCAEMNQAPQARGKQPEDQTRLLDAKGIDLTNADLHGSDLRGIDMRYTHFNYANLRGANLSGSDLQSAFFSNAHPELAKSLAGTKMYGAKGLSPEQITLCMGLGAEFIESPSDV